jgi:hypothetical protein
MRAGLRAKAAAKEEGLSAPASGPFITRLFCDAHHGTCSQTAQNDLVAAAGFWENTMNKIANLNLGSLENNLSALRTIISCVVLVLALAGVTAVALTLH